MKKWAPGILVFFVVFCSYGQNVNDSIRKLKGVEVKSHRLDKRQNAGMRETRVDSMLLQKKISLSLSELLSENTSVFIKSYGRGASATASFRGTAASHTQLNWNGLSISSPMTGMADFSLIPLYVVDEVTLRHGNASIADRSGGLGGSVNIANKADWASEKFGIQYLQSMGSYSSFDEYLQLSGGKNKVRLKTRIYHSYSKNDFTFINRGIANVDTVTGELSHPLDTNDNADYTHYGLQQELYYMLNSKNSLSAIYWFQNSERTLPRATSYEGPDNSNLNRQKDNSNRLLIRWRHYSKKTSLTVLGAYLDKQLDYSLKNYVGGQGLIPVIYSQSSEATWIGNVQWKYEALKTLSLEGRLDVNYYDVGTSDSVQKTAYDKSRADYSLFFSASKDFYESLNLRLMLRQDRNGDDFSPLIPYLGVSWKVLKHSEFFLKANIAGNYHQPSLNDLYWQPGGNPELKAEKGFSIELGGSNSFSMGSHSIKCELTAYRSDIDDWILWLPSLKGYWEARNIRRVLAKGLEFTLGISAQAGSFSYKLNGTYAYTSSVNYGDPLVWGDESYGKQLVYVPLHSGNVLINVGWKGFFVSWQHNSYSERFTTSSNDISRRDWLYPYYMNDLALGKELKIKALRLDMRFNIFNLFDETYHSVLYRPMPGRNFMLSIQVRY